MTWIELGNPTPHTAPQHYTPINWQVGEAHYLPIPEQLIKAPFGEVISARRTRRSFGPISANDLGALLWASCRVEREGHHELGFSLTLRPVPSAGAIHPIHVIANGPADANWWLYNPSEHRLEQLVEVDPALADVRSMLENIVPPRDATILLFAAEPGKTFAKYAEACSLLWRDAGVLIGHLSLVAEALGLSFCPLGVTGDQWVKKLNQQGHLAGVGMALVGSMD
ncbi:nitroreductase family protein [Azonexus fungiphilus]|uniref:nitroreductase family protein n=1 Tax=Azonexus fungiphilus TaxID=146940 RepID=UPI00156B046C|nr:SagB/ThcOx family dehydrogenase [Azonexus fungiphilus]